MKTTVATLAASLLLSLLASSASAGLMWDWNSGTEEGWVGAGNTDLTVEPGRNGTFGLGVTDADPPSWQISGQVLSPGSLALHNEAYIDVDRTIVGHGNFLAMDIIGEIYYSFFITYPFDGFGAIADLGDGWYRYHLVKTGVGTKESIGNTQPAGIISLHFVTDDDISTVPVVFDNLVINLEAPEPTSISLFTFALLGLAYGRRKRR